MNQIATVVLELKYLFSKNEELKKKLYARVEMNRTTKFAYIAAICH